MTFAQIYSSTAIDLLAQNSLYNSGAQTKLISIKDIVAEWASLLSDLLSLSYVVAGLPEHG